MKLQQLRYIVEVVGNHFNISTTAEKLYTSQPGISKQIRLLEEELEVTIFERSGKQLNRLTSAGEKIVSIAREILYRTKDIEAVAQQYTNPNSGVFNISTTHTQACYSLPHVIKNFIKRYPDVSLHIHQGTPEQMSEALTTGISDFVIATEALHLYHDVTILPCFHWNRSVVITKSHPLALKKHITIEDLADYPLITYVFGFNAESVLDQAFRAVNLTPKIAFTATDADVIKTYVRMEIGVGVVATMAIDKEKDQDLVIIDASHIFAASTTSIIFRKGFFILPYMFEFIELFSPHLSRSVIEHVLTLKPKDLTSLFDDIILPIK